MARFTVSKPRNWKVMMMSEGDYIIVLTPAELDTLRTSLRNESARLKTQGFTGLQAYVDNLRDKISNMMIDQAQTRLDNKASV
jgi:hypothetical protein